MSTRYILDPGEVRDPAVHRDYDLDLGDELIPKIIDSVYYAFCIFSYHDK